MKIITGELTINQLNTTNLNYSVALSMFKASGLCIEHNLSFVVTHNSPFITAVATNCKPNFDTRIRQLVGFFIALITEERSTYTLDQMPLIFMSKIFKAQQIT
ncbi:MAG: hypothetical protein ACJAYF_000431 [Arenicella sp.]|jgi:hypothetical protein